MKKLNIEKIIKNGGATLTRELEEAQDTRRYVVSVYGQEQVFKLNQLEELEKAVLSYAKSIKKGYYIGLWINDNKIYLDISTSFDRKNQAMEFGVNNKQIAIFDTKENKSLDVIYDKFYTIVDTKNKYLSDMNIASFDSLEEVASFFDKSVNYINRCINGQVLINDRYQVFKDCLLFEDVFTRKEAR